MLLDPQLLATLERLQLGTRRPLAGQISGAHRSRRYGSSLDFADAREYQPGDDYRRIDYLTLARLDQLVIRLYDADDDLRVDLVVDTSASMALDGKLRTAVELAAAIGFVALARRDVVRLHVPGRPPQRFSGRMAYAQLDRQLEALTARGDELFSSLVQRVLSAARPPGFAFVCSDLLDPEWERGIRRLPTAGADVAIAHVLGATDLEPPTVGDVDLVDIETGARVPVSLTRAAVESYRERFEAWADNVDDQARRRVMPVMRVTAGTDVGALVRDQLRRSTVLR